MPGCTTSAVLVRSPLQGGIEVDRMDEVPGPVSRTSEHRWLLAGYAGLAGLIAA